MPNNMKKAGIKYQKGGSKAPVASDYMGNPTGFFGDSARYRKAQMGTGNMDAEMFDMSVSSGPTPPKNSAALQARADRIFKKATEGSVNKRKAKAFKEGKDKKGQRLLNRINNMKKRAYHLDDKAAGRI